MRNWFKAMSVLRTDRYSRRIRQSVAALCDLQIEGLEDRCLLSTTVTIDALANRHPISPLIYGVHYADAAQLNDLRATLNRFGGTPVGTYNWQQNARNVGNDYYFESLDFGSATPGGYVDGFINQTIAGGAQPVISVPALDWIAKLGPGRSSLASFSQAKYGLQQDHDPSWFDAGNGVLQANGQFVVNDPNDAYVPNSVAIQQGWMTHLAATHGTANDGGVRYYNFDNEPGIWHATHRDIQPIGVTMQQVLNKMIAYGSAIKDVDPDAIFLGPEEWNYQGLIYSGYDVQYNADHGYAGVFPDRNNHGGVDYAAYLLTQLKANEQATGVRLLDYLSTHYYPQGDANGQHLEYLDNTVDTATQLLRNRSTRSLWDPNYTDVSYVNEVVRLIPRLRDWINNYYPGTKLALSEYSWGAQGHMNGATAQADVLGIMARESVDMAMRWEVPGTGTPAYNAMRLFRNYDGLGSGFGDTNVLTTTANVDLLSAFGALRGADGALTVVIDHKNLVDPANPFATEQVIVNIGNFTSTGTVQLYLLSAPNPNDLTQSAIVHLADTSLTGGSFNVNVPRQGVLMAVVKPSAPLSTRVDIIGRVQETGDWYVGVSNGTSFTTSQWTRWSAGNIWADVRTGDFNGDGKQDIVGRYQPAGQWYVGLSTGAGFSTSYWTTWSPGVTWADVQVGDFNADGKDDIVGRWGEGGQWYVGLSTGASFTTSFWSYWSPGVTWADVKVGDFNADGKDDIVGRWKEGGQWYAGLSTGTSFSTSFWSYWSSGVTWADVQVGDFNGDGRSDIVGRWSEGGQWYAGLSTGTSFATSFWSYWSPGVTWADVRVADFNGDGKSDIAGRWKEAGHWYVGLSTGTSFATSFWTAWTANLNWVDVLAGDFDGDGKADLGGRWKEAGQWYVGRSTGAAFSTSLWATWTASLTWTDVRAADVG